MNKNKIRTVVLGVLAVALVSIVISSCSKKTPFLTTAAPTGSITANVLTPTSYDNPYNLQLISAYQYGMVAYWTIPGVGTYQGDTVNVVIPSAGTYDVQLVVGGPGGVSDTIHQSVTITANNPYAVNLPNVLTGGKGNTAGQKWYIGTWTAMRSLDLSSVDWNMEGPSGYAPDTSMLNDVITFTPSAADPNSGGFSYNPNGDVFVNQSAASLFADGNPSGSFVTKDYTPPTNATWNITQENGKTYLTITNGFLSYITSPNDVVQTKYLVDSISNTDIKLIMPDSANGYVWAFELKTISSMPAPPPAGTWVGVTSPDNLWYSALPFTSSFYYATTTDWTLLPNPTLTVLSDTECSLSLPTATVAQFQAQVFLTPNAPLTISSGENYDFRVTLTASNTINNATVKITLNDGTGNTNLFNQSVNLPAGQAVVVTLTDLPGVTISPVSLFFDFGGNPANTTVDIKDIILQKHLD